MPPCEQRLQVLNVLSYNIPVIKTCGLGMLMTPLHAGSKDCYFLLMFILILNRLNDNHVTSKSAAVRRKANDASGTTSMQTLVQFLVLCNHRTQLTA